MKESTHVYALLKQAWGPTVHLVRVENSVSSGQPDVNGFVNPVEFWLESKIESKDRKFDLRPSQKAWFVARTRRGYRYHWVISRWENRITLWEPMLIAGELSFTPHFETHKPFDWNELLICVVRGQRILIPGVQQGDNGV